MLCIDLLIFRTLVRCGRTFEIWLDGLRGEKGYVTSESLGLHLRVYISDSKVKLLPGKDSSYPIDPVRRITKDINFAPTFRSTSFPGNEVAFRSSRLFTRSPYLNSCTPFDLFVFTLSQRNVLKWRLQCLAVLSLASHSVAWFRLIVFT